jgi:hypothetical protein
LSGQVRAPRRSRAERMRELGRLHTALTAHMDEISRLNTAIAELYGEEADRLDEDFSEE